MAKLRVYHDEKMEIWVKHAEDWEIGKEAIFAGELFELAMVNFGKFSEHLAKEGLKKYWSQVRKSLMDGLKDTMEYFEEK